MRRKSMLTKSLWCLLFLLPIAACPAATGRIISVDDDGPTDFNTIQAAIDDTNDGDTVLVAPGTYTGEGNRDIDFKGKAITVKSEEGPQNCSIDCQGRYYFEHSLGENCHRGFYFRNGEDANSVVQGFTITNGYVRERGGGICCLGSSPCIMDCILTGNAAYEGGGIACYESDVIVTGCVITSNIASEAPWNWYSSRIGAGGGIAILRGHTHNKPLFNNCIISGNSTSGDGGGVNCTDNPVLVNCTISENRTGEYGAGGGIAGVAGHGVLRHCIIWGNAAKVGDQISNMPGGILGEMLIELEYCVVQNGPNAVNDPADRIEGNWTSKEPQFVNPGYWESYEPNSIYAPPGFIDYRWIEGDYHLKSQAGRFDPSSGSWMVDQVTSPCIDAGDPNMPVGDEPEPNGGRINIGAYGGTPEASKSYILAKIIYVDDDAVGANDGSSWQNAYTFLQDALANAKLAEKPVEIRVAQGIYKPDQGVIQTLGDRTATFQLINSVTLKGGYAGAVEPNTIDIELYETILSGDLSRNDIDVNDTGDLRDTPHQYDYSWHVVTGSNTDETAVLDGFTITGGYISVVAYSLGRPPTGGAGMLIFSGSPTLIDCTFTDNVTGNTGGGLLIYDNSNPTLINCKFTRNNAESGGGIFSSRSSSPTLINCTFSDNYAKRKGGGMYIYEGNPKLTNCTFIRNSAPRSFGSTNKGGGMYTGKGSPVLTNCTFSDNMSDQGGAVYNDDGTSSILAGCTFLGNLADHYGGAVYNHYTDCNLMLTQCVFKQNSASQGGAMNVYCPTLLTNCIFTGNSAAWDGGAISAASAIFDNCIFTGNRAIGDKRSSGGAVHVVGGAPFDTTIKFDNCTFSNNWADSRRAIYCSGTAYVNNCIFWGSGDQIRAYNSNEFPFVDYSDIQGGWNWPGEGNIDADPCFADPGYWVDMNNPNIAVEPNDSNAVWIEGDYHLKSQAGRWDPNSQSWVVDDVTSPCIDAGDPNSPIGNEPFPNGGIINMGAYGGTAEASKSHIDHKQQILKSRQIKSEKIIIPE